MAREDLEKELRSLKQRLAREAELRAKEAKEFADRLKEVCAPVQQQFGVFIEGGVSFGGCDLTCSVPWSSR